MKIGKALSITKKICFLISNKHAYKPYSYVYDHTLINSFFVHITILNNRVDFLGTYNNIKLSGGGYTGIVIISFRSGLKIFEQPAETVYCNVNYCSAFREQDIYNLQMILIVCFSISWKRSTP